jgi:hypothetical protein
MRDEHVVAFLDCVVELCSVVNRTCKVFENLPIAMHNGTVGNWCSVMAELGQHASDVGAEVECMKEDYE